MNILLDNGFEIEQGGGGCQLLSKYIDNRGFIWATCIDGGGLPESENWMICAYGDGMDDRLFEANSESDLAIDQALKLATVAARSYRFHCNNSHRDSGRGQCIDCGAFL